jgi:nucleotide-binding universal stress UspA family protein
MDATTMFDVQRIMVATDFSVRAIRAETRAAWLCRLLALEALDLLTVHSTRLPDLLMQVLRSTETSQQTAATEQALQDLKITAEAIESNYGIKCGFSARSGDAVTEIFAVSEALCADLIVIGEPKESYLGKLRGTTADKLIRMANRPVLLVRNEPRHDYREVLVPIDFSAESHCAARLALKIAPNAHIIFLHAYHVWAESQMREAGIDEEVITKYRVKYGEEARKELNLFVAELGPIPQLVSRVVELGWAVPVISAYAGKMQPDLIVMGKHSGSKVEGFLLGSVTQRTIEQTRSDILVTPGQDPGNDTCYERPAA